VGLLKTNHTITALTVIDLQSAARHVHLLSPPAAPENRFQSAHKLSMQMDPNSTKLTNEIMLLLNNVTVFGVKNLNNNKSITLFNEYTRKKQPNN
jgi:hypothetical protein